ncbi:MAG: insulinase family protein [Flavobacteriales bacterium]|nr:MAG: insulinase family protein [Flavobacteriales bacterium]
MKNITYTRFTRYILLAALLASNFIYSQVDRSQIPPSGPDPEIKLGQPYEYELSNGLKLIIVENNKLPRASVNLFIDSQSYSSDGKTGIGSITSSLLGKGTKNILKDDFIEEIDFMGSTLSLYTTGAYGSSLSKYFPRILELLADGLLNPVFDEEEFKKEKDRLLESIKENEKSVTSIARRVGDIIIYGKNHPNAEYTSESSINNISFKDLEPYFKKRFIPNNAYMVIIGDIKAEETKERILDLFSKWEKGEVMTEDITVNNSFDQTEIHFIDMPNAIQSEIRFQNLIEMRKNSPDYISLLVANRILGGEPESRLESKIREDKGYAYYARSNFGSNKYSSTTFNAFTSSRANVTDSSVIELLSEIDKIKKVKVGGQELSDIKAAYFGDFVRDTESPSTIAQYSVDIKIEELDNDYYKNFIKSVNQVTSDDIFKVSNKYFNTDQGAIIIAGKGSELIDKLENITYDGKKLNINYYDTRGNIIDKPNYSIDDNVSVESIINNHIDAIGGKERLVKVESIQTSGSANLNMQGQSFVLEFYSIKNNQNQSLSTVKAGGMMVQKSVFNKYQGYNEVNGQRILLKDSELETAIIDSALFSELNYDFSTIELVGTSVINNEKVYEIKITDSKTEYYSIETGLKIKEVQITEVDGNQIVVETTINRYEEINGVLIPSEINQVTPALPIPGGITIKFSKIELDVKTSDSDFN